MIIAAAQFSARPCDIGANVARMAGFVTDADARGASLVVFAELAATGYELDAIVSGGDRLTMEPDDPRLAPVREACRAAGVAAVVNCAGRSAAGPVISSFVYGPDGAPLTRYDKTRVTDDERAAGFVPGSGDGRFTLGGVAFGLLICFDAHFPELTARAAADGCRVQLASSLYGRGGGEEEVRTVFPALAKDHGLYILLANHTGPSGPYEGCGRSGVWGPDGLTVASAREGEGLVVAELPFG
ncbi:hydrolase [Streptomyces eurocidicus]|uniref:Hydrolase n=1 Tax=Streptomyces eurocidicus TaxID=66423 RepID=A0A2N8P2G4_STREU|nr:carbon-nitrogen hydrolase family protein [Streptomyces eurocidicus]MBB5117347.1 putative amidohydrolase [Streptomyces eurocidicus]MBF6056572.1 carbon-nitrogen hydrolase family protein [Streptomyces eurocidicus]PNE35215.1 hydrolase [Streptomyces eurocidicus]